MISLLSFLCFRLVRASFISITNREAVESVEKPHPPGTPEFYWKLFISGVLVLAGGVFAGYAIYSTAPSREVDMLNEPQAHPRPHGFGRTSPARLGDVI